MTDFEEPIPNIEIEEFSKEESLIGDILEETEESEETDPAGLEDIREGIFTLTR